MNMDQTKLFIQEKIDTANYNTRGTATISLEGFNADDINLALEELKATSEYSRLFLDYNEVTKIVNIVDPEENIEGFENTHPSRKPCN